MQLVCCTPCVCVCNGWAYCCGGWRQQICAQGHGARRLKGLELRSREPKPGAAVLLSRACPAAIRPLGCSIVVLLLTRKQKRHVNLGGCCHASSLNFRCFIGRLVFFAHSAVVPAPWCSTVWHLPCMFPLLRSTASHKRHGNAVVQGFLQLVILPESG